MPARKRHGWVQAVLAARTGHGRARTRVVCALVFVAGLLLALFWRARFVDDAFITFRFAHNLADGHGLSWNIGEPSLEGYSNPLWVYLMALGIALGLDPQTLSYWVGACALSGVAALLCWRGRSLFERAWIPLASAVLILASGDVLTSYLMGMETGLYGLLLTAACALHVGAGAPRRSLTAARVAVLCALSITRFEGFLAALTIASVAALVQRCRAPADAGEPGAQGHGSGWGRKATLELPLLLAFVAASFAQRWLVFGELSPLPTQAKAPGLSRALTFDGAGLWEVLYPGLVYVWGFATLPVLLGALLVAIALVVTRTKPGPLWIPLAAVGFTGTVVLANGGDWMDGHRLLTPILGPLFLAALLAIRTLADRYAASTRIAEVALMIFAAVVVWQPLSLPTESFSSRPTVDKGYLHVWDVVGMWLDDATRDDDLCLIEQIGRIGYYGEELRIEDFQGLVNKHVARHGVASSVFGKRLDAYNLARLPAAIETNNLRVLEEIEHFYTATEPADYVVLSMTGISDAGTFVLVRADLLERPDFETPPAATWLPLKGATARLERFPGNQRR